MPRRAWEKLARALAPVALLGLAHCSLLFDVSSLDEGGGGADSSTADRTTDNADARDTGVTDALGWDVASPVDAQEAGSTADAQGDEDTGDDGSLADVQTEAGDGGAPDEADVACVTAFDAGRGQVLFDFATAAQTADWAPVTNAGNPVLTWTGGDGNTCPGALEAQINFTGYDGTWAVVGFTYSGSGASWAGTKLHAWIKIEFDDDGGAADYLALGGVQLFVSSNGWAYYSFVGANVSPAYSIGQWGEIVLDLSGADSGQPGRSGPNVVTSSVQQFGLRLQAAPTRPQNGPATPPKVTLLIDDVWLE